MNTATDSNKAVDDNINGDMNNKTEDVEKMQQMSMLLKHFETDAISCRFLGLWFHY